jgi:inorganic pyrophosphatase
MSSSKLPKNANLNPTPAYRAHPWHGVSAGDNAPSLVTCYVEIVPTDSVKFELDKLSGLLRVDRPQRFSNHLPALYGFIPQTFCGAGVGELCAKALKSKHSSTSGGKSTPRRRLSIKGDGDPLDVCILCDGFIAHGDILVSAKPIGGLRILDRNEADDKIIAVLDGDGVYGEIEDISELPKRVLDRLQHYFLTYKEIPQGGKGKLVEVAQVYGRKVAHAVIKESLLDYQREVLSLKRGV